MKFKYSLLLPIAEKIVRFIEPYCQRVVIAGSIRRKDAECGDIDIVAIPKFTEIPSLLGDPVLESHMDKCKLSELGILSANGSKLKKFTYRFNGEEIPVQIFIVTPPAEFGVVLAIRTGPQQLGVRMVTQNFKPFGYLSAGHYVKDGALWTRGSNIKVPCPEEEDFLNFLSMPTRYHNPEARTKFKYHNEDFNHKRMFAGKK